MAHKKGYRHVQDAYVRYTDVVFEWHQVLDPWQRNAVKALLGTDSLVHDQHPLHIDGTQGATLFLGVGRDGARRLLFSLKQLEYLQYYIHEMRLVSQRVTDADNTWIPLPGAAHLMMADAFASVEAINLPTSAALKNQLRHLSKYNNALHNPKAVPVPKEPTSKLPAAIDAGKDSDTRGDIEVRDEAAAAVENHEPQIRDRGNAIFFHAQQALTIASTGGTMAMVKDSPNDPARPTPIGRGLFLALDITTWELDEDIVLEFGYAAAWFERKLDLDEEGNVNPPKPGKDEEDTEMVLKKDRGHWTVQEHLNVHRNGLVKPDHRGQYLFGDTLPIQAKHFKGAVQAMISDLKRRAGDGADAVVYIIIHSSDAPLAELEKVGLDISTWSPAVVPSLTRAPAYADPHARGNFVLFDTAELFAAVEYDPADYGRDVELPGTTERTLEEVGMIMFGGDEAKAPSRLGNAGNDAFYTLEVFLAMASGPPLDVLRIDYHLSQSSGAPYTTGSEEARSDDAQVSPRDASQASSEPVLSKEYIDQAEAIAANFARDYQTSDDNLPVVDNDSPSDSEDDMDDIKGVFYGDVELDGDDDLGPMAM